MISYTILVLRNITFYSCIYKVHGNWGEWSILNLDPCTRNKTHGTVSRTRWCNNPEARYGGDWCDGINKDEKLCGDPEVQYTGKNE